MFLWNNTVTLPLTSLHNHYNLFTGIQDFIWKNYAKHCLDRLKTLLICWAASCFLLRNCNVTVCECLQFCLQSDACNISALRYQNGRIVVNVVTFLHMMTWSITVILICLCAMNSLLNKPKVITVLSKGPLTGSTNRLYLTWHKVRHIWSSDLCPA